MAKLRKVVKVEGMEVEDVVKSCVKLFGSARAEEVLPGIYEGQDLEDALSMLADMELADDVSQEEAVSIDEELEMEKIEVNEQGEEIMTKKQIKEKELDFDGIDAAEDTRTVEHDSGADNTENNLAYWLSNVTNEEAEDAVQFKNIVNKVDDGVYKGTVRSVNRFYSDKMGQFRIVINVNLPPVYCTAEHKGYFIQPVPFFMSLTQYRGICEDMGWDFNDMKSVAGDDIKIVVATEDKAKGKYYFIQRKAK